MDQASNQKPTVKIPPNFKCSLSLEIMLDPVTLITGITYEREKIEEWLKNNDTCPRTGVQLNGKKDVIANSPCF